MMALGLGLFVQSCNNGTTYAELKDAEREAIIHNILNFFILFILNPDKSNKSSGNFTKLFDVLY